MPWEALFSNQALDFGTSFMLLLYYEWCRHTGRIYTRDQWESLMRDKDRLQDIVDKQNLRTELKLEEYEKELWRKEES